MLAGCYASTKDEICAVLETLLRTREIVVAQSDTVCSQTATFDRNAATGCGMRLID